MRALGVVPRGVAIVLRYVNTHAELYALREADLAMSQVTESCSVHTMLAPLSRVYSETIKFII